jgi:hypothetical protein
MSTGLAERVVRPVLLGRLDIATDPLVAWTGPGVFAPTGTGDTALDGEIFATMAPIMALTNISEDQGIGGPVTITLTGHDLDEDLLRQIVRDTRQWRGRGAWLWSGLLMSNEASVIADPIRIKTGVMTSIKIYRDKNNAGVAVTIDKDIGFAKSAPFRWLDHARFWSTDTFSSFIVKLANKPQGFETGGYRPRGWEDGSGHVGGRRFDFLK